MAGLFMRSVTGVTHRTRVRTSLGGHQPGRKSGASRRAPGANPAGTRKEGISTMRRFRIRRRRALAIALVPAAALTISTSSSAAGAEQRQAAIDPAKPAVPLATASLCAASSQALQAEAVAILHRRANGERFEQVRATRTDRNSRWSVRVKPQGTGMWRARLSSAPRSAEPGEHLLEQPTAVDSETGAKRVRVRSTTRSARRTTRWSATASRSRAASGPTAGGRSS